MQLTNVSAKDAAATQAAKPETFKGFDVKAGKLQENRWFPSATSFARSSLETYQKEYNTQKATKKAGQEVALWKRPFVFLRAAASNLANMIANAFKTVFFCFFKAEDAKDGEKAGEKKDTSKVADKK